MRRAGLTRRNVAPVGAGRALFCSCGAGGVGGDAARRRGGFTLIELMMVIVIIALLIGLLLPAITGAVTRAREGQVTAEMQGLQAAIADFKAQFGFEPPSALVLHESASGWGTNDAITRESRSVLRKMFPQIDFNDLDGSPTTTTGSDVDGPGNVRTGADINGDGTVSNQPIVLNGAECLVFFLGGVQEARQSGSTTPPTMLGFSKNPRAPFSRTGNRLGPFFSSFNTGRLGDNNGNGMAELRDPLPSQQNPYWYISSDDGRGYSTPSTNLNGSGQPQPTQDLAGSGMTDCYRQSPPDTTSNPPKPGTAHNPKSYQIISPGYDGLYGTGGFFDPQSAATSLSTPPLGATARDPEPERDNITNFHMSRLSP